MRSHLVYQTPHLENSLCMPLMVGTRVGTVSWKVHSEYLWHTVSAVAIWFRTLRYGGILGKLRSVQGGRDWGSGTPTQYDTLERGPL